MSRRTDENQKSRTHFEQVPLEEVKKVTQGDTGDEEDTGIVNLVFELPSNKTEPYSMPPDSILLKRL